MRGYTIDCDYLIRVKDYMTELPRPTKKLTDIDGSKLEIISVECDV